MVRGYIGELHLLHIFPHYLVLRLTQVCPASSLFPGRTGLIRAPVLIKPGQPLHAHSCRAVMHAIYIDTPRTTVYEEYTTLMSNFVRSAVHDSFCIGCKIMNRIRSSVTSKVTGSRGQLVGAGLVSQLIMMSCSGDLLANPLVCIALNCM